MTLVLSVLRTFYTLQGAQRTFSYSPPSDRAACKDIKLIDSTRFLGDAVLPGIPAIDDQKALGLVGRFSRMTGGYDFLETYRKLIELEYQWSPIKEAFLFHHMMNRFVKAPS